MKMRFFLAALLSLSVTAAKASDAITAKYIDTPLKMDGKMSDPAWKKASETELKLPLKAYQNQPETLQKILGTELREKGTVKLLWDDKYLYVGAKFEDSDVLAEGLEDQEIHCGTGDLLEIFVKPEKDACYWEIYATPHDKKTCLFYPGRGRHFLPSVTKKYKENGVIVKAHIDGTFNDWRDKDRGWSVEVAIPISMLNESGVPFAASEKWTVFLSRYNYSRYLPLRELSAFPRLSNPNFHINEEYAKLILEK